MSQRKLEVVADPGSPRIVMRRVLDAPRTLVFDAFTKPELVTRWKTPKQFEVKQCDLDLRVGGTWSITYRMPNGADIGFHGEFSEVVKPERVVRTFCMQGKPGKMMTETFIFEESGGGTLVTTIHEYETVEARDAAAAQAAGGSMEAAYQILDELLPQLAA